MRTMTKSVLQVVRNALAAGEVALPTSASCFSRQDYMRPQLYALLVLRRFLRTDYCSIVMLAGEWRELREAHGLTQVLTTPRWPLPPRG